MKPYLFKIGNFELRIYSLMYIIAFLVGIFIASKDKVAEKRGIKDKKMIEDFAFWAIISGLIGARLYYVIFKFSEYMISPISILKVWEGGLAIHGGIIGGLIGSYLYAKKYNLNIWVLTDMGVGPLLFGQFLGRFGNLANGEVHGVPTFTPLNVIFTGNFNQWWISYQSMSLEMQAKFKELIPWGIVFPKDTPAGIEFPDYPLHPAMLYESFLNLIGFLLLWFYFRKKEYNPGVLSMIYLIIYGVIRIFVSTFRAEDLMVYGIRAPYMISLLMFVFAFIGIKYFGRKNRLYKK
ncbi:prolipoprotein diacylglyceryl transferase [Leptotrichia sp. OH3620_COT-345]|uniref:prolipoprotein diacylglyceryl transferase n=1 Tax=Leptotrichia sp. OH3620_COT-345 TaxID=2491048 RepID=UPI000F64E6B8|nr:prolipoprotein diacylglyceryl transferase [Leptotrichia sp. OH3620_COT-345]RRD40104.1 prolipoprotein diacylglyceryl transferase [Leptotrichia sp. OH3620_COT-345]